MAYVLARNNSLPIILQESGSESFVSEITFTFEHGLSKRWLFFCRCIMITSMVLIKTMVEIFPNLVRTMELSFNNGRGHDDH